MSQDPTTLAHRDQQATAQPRRDAIVYLQGMNQAIDQSAQTISRNIANALDKNAQSPQAVFSAGAVTELNLKSGTKVQVCAIERHDQDEPEVVAEVYTVNIQGTLTTRLNAMSLASKCLWVTLALIAVMARLVRPPKPGKTGRELVQVVFSCFFLLLGFAYLLLLLYALVVSLADVLKLTLPWLPRAQLEWPKTVVLTATALGLVLPPLTKFQEVVSAWVINYLSIFWYLNAGEKRNVSIGRFRDVVEYLSEQSGMSYDGIHVLTYSFGGIVALDTFFPLGQEPSVRLKGIDSLTTIGIPFDFVRSLWPKYFSDRCTLSGVPQRWFNIYAPEDIFGSNFRNDATVGDAEIGIMSTNFATEEKPNNRRYIMRPGQGRLSLVDLLTFYGLRSHAMYWEQGDEPQINCFDIFVTSVYDKTTLLR